LPRSKPRLRLRRFGPLEQPAPLLRRGGATFGLGDGLPGLGQFGHQAITLGVGRRALSGRRAGRLTSPPKRSAARRSTATHAAAIVLARRCRSRRSIKFGRFKFRPNAV
jgi:hypothetical protein